jgi:hypothetical protein
MIGAKRADTLRNVAPSREDDDGFRRWWATLMRLGASPRAVLLLGEMTMAVDVRDLLPRLTVPTLVMHRVGDRVNDIALGRYLAERILGARWVELPGEDFALWAGDLTALADEIEEFLTGHRSGPEATKVVTTVMFTGMLAGAIRSPDDFVRVVGEDYREWGFWKHLFSPGKFERSRRSSRACVAWPRGSDAPWRSSRWRGT